MLEKIAELVKEAGFRCLINENKVIVINNKDEIIGQFATLPNNKFWFYVYDTEQQCITPEGGECALTVLGVRNIIEEFRYR